jgi:hypothetical protein
VSRNVKVKMHKTVILSVVLYGCGTWFLITLKKHKSIMFQNRMLRKIFGPKRDEVTRGRSWRELHNGELRDLYSTPCIIGMMKSKWMKWTGRGVYSV